jgi:hypothetical protein
LFVINSGDTISDFSKKDGDAISTN